MLSIIYIFWMPLNVLYILTRAPRTERLRGTRLRPAMAVRRLMTSEENVRQPLGLTLCLVWLLK